MRAEDLGTPAKTGFLSNLQIQPPGSFGNVVKLLQGHDFKAEAIQRLKKSQSSNPSSPPNSTQPKVDSQADTVDNAKSEQRRESETNVATAVSSLLTSLGERLPALGGLAYASRAGVEANIGGREAPQRIRSRWIGRDDTPEQSFLDISASDDHDELSSVHRKLRAVEIENVQLYTENEMLQDALDEAGENISQLLASERALKQSAISLCAALSGLAEDDDELQGTPLAAGAIEKLSTDLAHNGEIDVAADDTGFRNGVEGLQGALANMQQVDVACSMEVLGAHLSARAQQNAFLGGLLAAQVEVTKALEAQIDELNLCLLSAGKTHQQGSKDAAEAARLLMSAREEAQAQERRVKELERAAMIAAIGFEDSKQELQQTVAQLHKEIGKAEIAGEKRVQELQDKWEREKEEEKVAMEEEYKEAFMRLRREVQELQEEHKVAFKQAHAMSEKHEQRLLQEQDALRQDKTDVEVALRASKQELARAAAALAAAQKESSAMQRKLASAEQETVRAAMLSSEERPIFILRKEAEVLAMRQERARADREAEFALRDKTAKMAWVDERVEGLCVRVEEALGRAAEAQRAKDACMQSLREAQELIAQLVESGVEARKAAMQSGRDLLGAQTHSSMLQVKLRSAEAQCEEHSKTIHQLRIALDVLSRQADDDRASLRRLQARQACEEERSRAEHDELQEQVLALQATSRTYLVENEQLKMIKSSNLMHTASSSSSKSADTDTHVDILARAPPPTSHSLRRPKAGTEGQGGLGSPTNWLGSPTNSTEDDGFSLPLSSPGSSRAASVSGSWWSTSSQSGNPSSQKWAYKKGLF